VSKPAAVSGRLNKVLSMVQVSWYIKTVIVPMYHRCSNALKVVRTNCLNNQANGQTKSIFNWKLSDGWKLSPALFSYPVTNFPCANYICMTMHMYGCLNGIPCMYQWCLHPLCYNQLWMNLRFNALLLYLGNWLSSRRKRMDLTTWDGRYELNSARDDLLIWLHWFIR